MEESFSTDWGTGRGGYGFRMIQEHYIYRALYFYYYYISSTSDHQASDPGGWGPLAYRILLRTVHHLRPTRIDSFTNENWDPKKSFVPDPTEGKTEERGCESRPSNSFFMPQCVTISPQQQCQMEARWKLRLGCWPLGSCGLPGPWGSAISLEQVHCTQIKPFALDWLYFFPNHLSLETSKTLFSFLTCLKLQQESNLLEGQMRVGYLRN